MTSILSVYYDPTHDRQSDLNYIRSLQPAWVRIHQVTARSLHVVQELAPDAKIMLRRWEIDDNNGERKQEAYANPRAAAATHLDRWDTEINMMRAEAKRNGWGLDESKWHIGLINEPDPNHLPQIVEYTDHAMRITSHPLGVGVSSVGTFGKPGEPNSWDLFKPLEHAIKAGGHILIAHEHWQPEGPAAVWTDDEGKERHDAGNLAWRHHSIPLDVDILIGEAGVNGYIYNRHSTTDDAGWQRYMAADQFAAQTREYILGCSKKVRGVCMFITDYHSQQWRTFDTEPAHAALLRMASGLQSTPTPTPPADTKLVHPLPGSIVSQHWGQTAPEYSPGMWGHSGTDLAGPPAGTPVRNIAAGTVAFTGFDPGYGNYCRVAHEEIGIYSFYAHLQEVSVAVEQRLAPGQTIGLLGWTGNVKPPGAQGAHLHLEIRLRKPDGSYSSVTPMPNGRIDPESWFSEHDLKL